MFGPLPPTCPSSYHLIPHTLPWHLSGSLDLSTGFTLNGIVGPPPVVGYDPVQEMDALQ